MIAKFAYLVPALVVSFLLVGSNSSFAQSNPCAGNNPCAASKQSNRFAGKMVSNLIFPLSCACGALFISRIFLREVGARKPPGR